MHWLAQSGDLAGMRTLVSQGAELDVFDDLGKTPLHYAAEAERLDIVAFLLDSGADVDAHDESVIGNTPLAEVAATCTLQMARLLIEAGADPTVPGWMQLTALDRARNRKRGDGPAVYALFQTAARK
jgi:ankyrin repeat protein